MNDIQQIIDAIKLAVKLESAKEYSLRYLIEDLRKCDQSLIVHIDTGEFPEKHLLGYAEVGDATHSKWGFDYEKKQVMSIFSSYRGSYNQLAIQHSNVNNNITVAEVLEMAEFVNGKYLCGYKGGDFLMDLDTPIHINNYYTYGGPKLIGAIECDGAVVLITRKPRD